MKILLVDEVPVVRIGMRILLSEHFPHAGFTEASCLDGLIEAVYAHKPDLLITDFQLVSETVFDILAAIHVLCPATAIICLTRQINISYSHRMLQIGVRGILPKNVDAECLLDCVLSCMKGDIYVHESIMVDDDNLIKKLSRNEFDIMLKLVEGHGTSQIAKARNVGIGIISTYKSRIFEKVKVKSVVELIILYRRMSI